MVRTTPPGMFTKHASWHVFIKGGCDGCGYYCDDCPIGVATCKCQASPEDIEAYADARLKEENLGITDDWN